MLFDTLTWCLNIADVTKLGGVADTPEVRNGQAGEFSGEETDEVQQGQI